MLFLVICKFKSEMAKVSRGRVIVENKEGGKYEILDGYVLG
jgi:hypothetical protein